MAQLDDFRVAILATDGFEQVELTDPRKALEKAGAKTEVIAPHDGTIQGFKHHDKADTVRVDRTLDQASPDDYDAILLPGGALNADALRVDEQAQRFVQRMQQSHKPFAIICHAPWTLVSAGLVKGRTLTSYHTIRDDVRNAGATWKDQEVVHDDNWVSSRSPKDLPAFDKAMVELFAQSRTAHGH